MAAQEEPAPSPGPQPIPRWPGRMVSLGDSQVFVRSAATGADPAAEQVLCVHGLEGSASNWTDMMGELLPDYASSALDLPGFGYSPPPTARSGYSVTGQAETVAALIERLYDGPVHLIGNSLGGAVTIRLAAARPELVRSLTLVSPMLPDQWPHPSLIRFPLICVPGGGEWALRRVSALSAQRRFAATLQAVYYDPTTLHPSRYADEIAEIERRDRLGYPLQALVSSARSLVAENYRNRLWREAAQIDRPALVVFGSHDRLIDPRLAGRAAREFRDARVVVLPRTGHVAQIEHPAKVAAEVRSLGMRATAARLSSVQV